MLRLLSLSNWTNVNVILDTFRDLVVDTYPGSTITLLPLFNQPIATVCWRDRRRQALEINIYIYIIYIYIGDVTIHTTFRLQQNGYHFADDSLKSICLDDNCGILIWTVKHMKLYFCITKIHLKRTSAEWWSFCPGSFILCWHSPE